MLKLYRQHVLKEQPAADLVQISGGPAPVLRQTGLAQIVGGTAPAPRPADVPEEVGTFGD